MAATVLTGNIVSAPELGRLDITEKGYMVLEDGVIAGIYDRLPEEYRNAPLDKAQLLYTYLITRFSYREQETVTPVYSALCEGIADPQGLAQGWKLICDRAGVECYVVQGLKNGQPYTWNIFSLDGEYRHTDLAQCVLERGGLVLRTDKNMSEYHWDIEQYPVCETRTEEEN